MTTEPIQTTLEFPSTIFGLLTNGLKLDGVEQARGLLLLPDY